MIDELCVGDLVHGLDPAEIEGPGEGVLAVHLVLQHGHKRVQDKLVALRHNILKNKHW